MIVKEHDETETLKCYYMLELGNFVAVTGEIPKNQKVDVAVDKYIDYSHDLTHTQQPKHLIALTSHVSSILYTPKSLKHVTKLATVNACDYLNLFGEAAESDIKKMKVKMSPLASKPTTATTAKISLIRSGKFPIIDFTEHLKYYFSSSKLLHTGHIFSLNIPKIVPKNVDLKTWLSYLTNNLSFAQQTYQVHFKVTCASLGDEDLSGFFYISSDVTTLYQTGDVHIKLPCYLPSQRIDMFYRDEIEQVVDMLRYQRGRPLFPVILAADRGSCKEDIIRAVSGHMGVGVVHVRAINYCGEAPGALEAKFKHLFTEIKQCTPSLVHFDQLHLLGRTRDGMSADARVILALKQLFSDLATLATEHTLYIVGTCTSDTSTVLMEIRHLFNMCVSVTKRTVAQISSFLKSSLQFDDKFDLDRVVSGQLYHNTFRKTLKFVDTLSAQRGLGLNDNQIISQKQCEDVLADLNIVDTKKPATIPQTSWEDMGGISHVRREVEETIEIPLKYPHLFSSNIRRSGLLLHGKPGCGKTLVARAIASQCSLHFISVQGPELLNSFVGQSEDNVRKLFEKARKLAPSIIFFDEIDAIAPKRCGGVIDRVLAQLLSEMDGVHESKDIFMIGATNRPELLDPAITRPGRLDKRVEVAVGNDIDSRVEVFQALSRNLKLSECVNFMVLSEISGKKSGAECYGILLEACYKAIERCIAEGNSVVEITQNDLISVVTKY